MVFGNSSTKLKQVQVTREDRQIRILTFPRSLSKLGTAALVKSAEIFLENPLAPSSSSESIILIINH